MPTYPLGDPMGTQARAAYVSARSSEVNEKGTIESSLRRSTFFPGTLFTFQTLIRATHA